MGGNNCVKIKLDKKFTVYDITLDLSPFDLNLYGKPYDPDVSQK